jgi:PiT family inorganic phosphate transporter
VFQQKTFIPVEYRLTAEAELRIAEAGIPVTPLLDMRGNTYPNASQFRQALAKRVALDNRRMNVAMVAAKIDQLVVAVQVVNRINDPSITDEQKKAVRKLWGKNFTHRWQLENALAEQSPEWRPRSNDKEHNEELRRKLDYVCRLIRTTGQ